MTNMEPKLVDEKVWQILDKHRDHIASHDVAIAVMGSRTSSLERGHSDVCIQIKVTEAQVMSSQIEIKKDLLLVIGQLDQMKGEKKAFSWIPIIIQSLVGLSVLYAVLTRSV